MEESSSIQGNFRFYLYATHFISFNSSRSHSTYRIDDGSSARVGVVNDPLTIIRPQPAQQLDPHG